jgi:uncharacterized membrane protein
VIKVKESKGKNSKFPLLMALFCLVKGKVFSFFLLFFLSLFLNFVVVGDRREKEKEKAERNSREIFVVGWISRYKNQRENRKIKKK